MLFAYYRLDGDATDSVGGNDGTPENVSWVDGKLGQAMESQDYTEHVSVENTFMNIPRNTFSLSLWVKLLDVSDFVDVFEVTDGAWNGQGVSLYLRPHQSNGEHIAFNINGDALRTSTLEGNVWYSIIATFDGTTKKVFLDGVEQGSSGQSEPIAAATHPIYIGNGEERSHEAAKVIDDVRIYDHALSEREVRDLSHPLVFHLKGNEDLNDRTGQVTTLTNMGATFDDNTPVGGGSYLFDGVDDYISTGYNFPEMVGDISYTLTAWIYLTDSVPETTLSGAAIFGHASSDGFGLQVSDNRLNFGMRGNSNFSGNTHLEVGKWYFCVGTRVKGEDSYIYLNGELDANKGDSTTIDINATNDEVQVGAAIGRLDRKFPGYITDVRVYNDYLTEQQIKELYQQRASIDNEGSFHAHHLSGNTEEGVGGDIEGTYHSNSNFGLHLDVKQPCVLYSCDMDSDTDTTVELRLQKYEPGTGAVGDVLQSLTVDVKSGFNYVKLGFPIHETGDFTIYKVESDPFIRTGTGFDFSQYNNQFLNVVQGVRPSGSATYDRYYYFFNLKVVENMSVEHTGSLKGHFSEVGPIDGAVGWWPLIKDTNDYVGTNDAVSHGGDLIGTGYEFIDNSDGLETDLIPNYESFTYSFWAKVYDFASVDNWDHILGNAKRGQSGGFNVYNGSRDDRWRLICSTNDSDGNRENVQMYINTENVWVLITVTHKNGISTGYLDGEQQQERSTGYATRDDNFFIKFPDGSFEGVIADTRIYNRALSAEEVAILYEMTNPESTTKVKQTADTVYTRGQIIEQ